MAGISANHYVTHIDHTLERGAGFVFEGCFGLKEGGAGRTINAFSCLAAVFFKRSLER